jgi:KaiC/GvpD/RAD55 family RecA-like ATPase
MLAVLGVKELPPRSVLLVEEELGCTTQLFVQRVAFEAAESGKVVRYITPRWKEDVSQQMDAYGLEYAEKFEILEHFRDRTRLQEVCTGDLCIIEHFTSLFVDCDLTDLIHKLVSFIDASRNEDRIFLLTSDMGVIPRGSEMTLRSLVDGVIQFLAVRSGDRIHRFIHIPKLNGRPYDRMIPFTVDAEGITIDTRDRIE